MRTSKLTFISVRYKKRMYDFKKFVIIALVDFVIFQLLYFVASTSGKIDDIIEAGKKKPQQALVCHVCHSEGQRECTNFSEQGDDFYGFPHVCASDATACMVRKFAFTLTNETTTQPMKTIAVKRNCTRLCEPSCLVLGERTRLYVCNTCCSTPLCNVGSGSNSIMQTLRRHWTWIPPVIIASLMVLQASPSELGCKY